MNDEFENALAWFSAAPKRWINSAKQDLSACAEWIWGVLQGDFNENASTSQVVTSTVVSMIPFVDQICDVRDVVANCKKINGEPREVWHWVALVLTLIGLFLTLGSLFKGCGKVVFASLRKAASKTGVASHLDVAVGQAIVQLNKFLARPEVAKTLKALKINNPYKYLAKKFRELAAQITVSKLMKAFDEARQAAASMLGLVEKWGGAALAQRATDLLKMIDGVRRQADAMLAKALKPAQDMLMRTARRLDYEADMAHRAHLNVRNPHAFVRPSSAEELTEFQKAKPAWVQQTTMRKYPGIRQPRSKTGWKSTKPDPKKRHPVDNAHTTFNTMAPITLQPGDVIYRVLDPNSSDNSICWMSKAEFEQLKSKDDWRKRFAVWASWNNNGEYITYTVPPGQGLNVWEGVTASQKMDGQPYVLEGGARQIVVNPDDLVKNNISKRKSTNWGYNNFNEVRSLVGVPMLKNYWYGK